MTTPTNWLALCASLALGETCGLAISRYAAVWPVAALCLGALTLALYAVGMKGLKFVIAFFTGIVLALYAAHQRNETLAEALWRNSGSPFQRILVVEGEAREFSEKNGVRWTSFPCSTGNLRLKVIFPRPADEELPRVGERWDCAGWLARTKDDNPSRRRILWIKGKETYARRIKGSRGAFAAQNGLHCDRHALMGGGYLMHTKPSHTRFRALACKVRMRPDHGSSPNMETVYP